MKHFFVLGNETSKSLSPTIFNHWFKKHKIKAKYTFLEVKKKRNLNKALLNKLKEKNICGYNITMPYKKDVFAYLDKKNTHSNKIGAVNCVVVKKKSTGINTDWIGYLRSIRGFGINKNKKILVLGYGGASMAIVYGFLSKGYKDIVVLNRSKKQINFNGTKTYTKKYSCLGEHLGNADLIINTTPTNQLKKKQSKMVKKTAVVSDIVYKPKETSFLKQFSKNKKVYGISMLVEQAAPSFKAWFGFWPDVDQELLDKLDKKIK